MNKSLLLLLASAALANAAEPPKEAVDAIDSAGLLEHIKVLASDEFEGRAPGTPGEAASVAYLTVQFKRLGLQPGNPDGSYVQEVPLAGIRGTPTASFTVGANTMPLKSPSEYVAFTQRIAPQVAVKDSEMIFVGYGVVAPEYGWDDFKGVDVRGKTLVFLINDPPIPDPSDPAKLDAKMFKGKAMTYYGRWNYKYEIAAKLGAAAAVIVHETIPAAYPWSVVENSNSKENFVINAGDKNAGTVAVRSWIAFETAQKLFAATGRNFDELKKAAMAKDFQPVVLGAKANFLVENKVREFRSQNVVAKVAGSDPLKKDEYVIYTAHWDHLGRDLRPPEQRPARMKGDDIYNGAQDNASGTAAIVEIAQAFRALPEAPPRSVLFIATTGEEAGLLGAQFYATHPLYPLEQTLAGINIDGLNPWGKTRDIEEISFGLSTLGDLLARAAERQGRVVKPNSEPEKGGFFRSDHFELSKLGVPALYASSRPKDFIGKPAEFGQQMSDDYTLLRYHQVSDQVEPSWDLSGAVQDVQLLFEVGYQVVTGDAYPEWARDAEFKAVRDAMMAGRK